MSESKRAAFRVRRTGCGDHCLGRRQGFGICHVVICIGCMPVLRAAVSPGSQPLSAPIGRPPCARAVGGNGGGGAALPLRSCRLRAPHLRGAARSRDGGLPWATDRPARRCRAPSRHGVRRSSGTSDCTAALAACQQGHAAPDRQTPRPGGADCAEGHRDRRLGVAQGASLRHADL